MVSSGKNKNKSFTINKNIPITNKQNKITANVNTILKIVSISFLKIRITYIPYLSDIFEFYNLIKLIYLILG